jgi:hypothetical protein
MPHSGWVDDCDPRARRTAPRRRRGRTTHHNRGRSARRHVPSWLEPRESVQVGVSLAGFAQQFLGRPTVPPPRRCWRSTRGPADHRQPSPGQYCAAPVRRRVSTVTSGTSRSFSGSGGAGTTRRLDADPRLCSLATSFIVARGVSGPDYRQQCFLDEPAGSNAPCPFRPCRPGFLAEGPVPIVIRIVLPQVASF